LVLSPLVYTTFLLWLLSELFETLPEMGDLDKPRLVFFFDEAHLLFDNAPKPLVQKVEQVIRLIRSKGVGVFFITQNPQDIPDSVLSQLGNRIQHALRAFTPKEQAAVRVAAQSFRANPTLDTMAAITELQVGEALISVLDERGTPTVVERTLIVPPCSRLGVLSLSEREQLRMNSRLRGLYDTPINRVSAAEMLVKRVEQTTSIREEVKATGTDDLNPRRNPGRPPQSMTETVVKTVIRSVSSTIGSTIGRQIVRGILGSILKR
jgi:uncharacterized protein